MGLLYAIFLKGIVFEVVTIALGKHLNYALNRDLRSSMGASAMQIIGIIGPYISGGNRRLIDHNIANVQYLAIAIADYFGDNKLVGFFAPHNHTARFEQLARAPELFYHTLDDTLYDRGCDGFVILPKWDKSTGAKRDCERAVRRGMPIFELVSYANKDVNKLLCTLEQWALEKEEQAKSIE